MKYHLLIILHFLFFLPDVISQTVTIVDAEDLRPVPDVIILNDYRTKYFYSGRNGKADISEFRNEKTICFQHFSYERICVKYEELAESGFEVRLKKKVFAIEEFVVSANRWEQSRFEVPNRVRSVHLAEIRMSNPQTAADLIGMSGEVFIQKSQLGGGSPMIRGFATNRVLIVVDGVRLNNAIYREGNIQNVISLDPSSINSTEIIMGPGAVVYGSDAIGGVMDCHTMEPVFSGGKKLFLKGNGMLRYSSANNEKSVHLDINAGKKNIAFLSGISWSDFGDLKMGSYKNADYQRTEYAKLINGSDSVIANADPRVQVHSGYSQLYSMNKLKIRITPFINLVAANHFSRISEVPRYDRLIQYRAGNLRYGEWYYGPQVWMMNYLRIKFNRQNILFSEASLTASLQSYRESRHNRTFGNYNMEEQTEKVKIYSVNLDLEKKFRSTKELLYYGFEMVFNDIVSVAGTKDIFTGVITPAGTRYPDGDNRYISTSVYGGYKNNITDKLTLNTGLRYNHVKLNSEIEDNSFYNFPFTSIRISNGAVTGSAGMVLRMNKKAHIRLNASTGFRAPNLDDAGKVFDSAPGIVVVPNPDLKPEYAWNIDLGITKEFGTVLHTEVTFFHTWLNDVMVRNDFLFNGNDSIYYNGELSKVEALTNSGSAIVYGMNLTLQLNILKNLNLRSNINLTEGYEENGDPLRHVAPVFGSTHLVFKTSRFETDLYSIYNGPRKFKKMAPTELEKPYLYATDENNNPWSPGWYTLNLKLSYSFINRITVMAGVENILDHRYRPYSSGIVSAGRNFIISLNADF
ncbi:MAG TPA: TonB-dependent receptor [Bacteroidales bacterium]|nr:TonB-dependent receptor [Bacteroidales bacterium]